MKSLFKKGLIVIVAIIILYTVYGAYISSRAAGGA